MNPTENRGAGFSQPSGGIGLPGMPQNQAQALPPNSAPASKEGSVLEVTLEQLTRLTTQYSQDPYQLTKEIERLKSAYLSTEFGRILKATDS